MSEWREGRLADIADFVMGQSPEGDTCNEKGTGVPLLNGPTEFGIRNPKAVQFTTDPKRYSKLEDILFCVRGSTTGKMNWSDREYAIGRGLAALTHKNGTDYIYYLKALLDYNLDHLLASATGSTFPNVSKEQIANLEVSIAPLEEQKAIASLLSSLDDKIDLLHRQNITLERMAETLFRQLFVEDAQEDWEEKLLSFYGEIVCGKTPSKQKHAYFNGDMPFIKIPDMHSNTFIFRTEDSLTELGKYSQKNKTIPALSICVSCIATVGLVSITTKPSQTNQQINSIIPKHNKYRYFLYLTMKASYDLLQAEASGGTATLNLNTGNFSKITVTLPPESLLLEFESIVNPLFNKIQQNQSQVQTLEKLRDNLLPKLMSGEVRVALPSKEQAA